MAYPTGREDYMTLDYEDKEENLEEKEDGEEEEQPEKEDDIFDIKDL